MIYTGTRLSTFEILFWSTDACNTNVSLCFFTGPGQIDFDKDVACS